MRKAILRQVKLWLMVFLGYLCQVCIVSPYVQLGKVSPSLLLAMVAIVTVGYGRLRALWAGAFYGILMETFLPGVSMLNLLYYPVSALLCSVFFADKSAPRLQYERSIGKAGRNISPLLRTVLCAALIVTIYEMVNLVYMYLNGAGLTGSLIRRGLADVFGTTLLTAIIMIPVRKLLGFRKMEEEHAPEMRFDHRPARD